MRLFAERLEYLIKLTGIKPSKIAEISGLTPGQISKYRRAKQSPGIDTIISLKQVFPDYFFWLVTGKGNPPSQESVTYPLVDIKEPADNQEQLTSLRKSSENTKGEEMWERYDKVVVEKAILKVENDELKARVNKLEELLRVKQLGSERG